MQQNTKKGSAAIALWIGIALAGAVVCLAITKKWGQFRRNDA